jgi:hypothetical protein
MVLPGRVVGQEIPYSSVFTESASVGSNPFRNQLWSADPQLQFGQGSAFRATHLSLGLNLGLDLPLQRSAPPEDAMLRLGPLYANMPRTYMDIIASDNADRTNHDRHGGVIGMVASDFDILLRLTDSFHIAAKGSFIYLPFENQVGFSGFGFFDESAGLNGDVSLGTDLFIEAKLDGMVGGWDFFVADRVGLQPDKSDLYSYRSADVRLHYLRANEFDKADTLGRYTLGGRGRRDDGDNGSDYDSDSDDRWGYSTAYYYNKASAGISRMVPTDTYVGLTVFRTDRWGMDGEGRGDRDTEWTEGVNLSLINQHYNMRFKPYATYTASTNSEDHYWRHVVRLGVAGPLSEYTDLDANVGYAWISACERKYAGENSRKLLWNVRLQNELNQLTTQRLSYSRYIQPDSDQYHTTLAYSLHRVLGPYLDSSLFAARTEVESGDDQDEDETRYEAGAALVWDATSRLDLTLTGIMSVVRWYDQDSDYKEYLVRLAADYDLSDTLALMLSYEYVRRTDDVPDEAYYENLVRLRLTKKW